MSRLELREEFNNIMDDITPNKGITEEMILNDASTIAVREDILTVITRMQDFRKQQQEEKDLEYARYFIRFIIRAALSKIKTNPYATVFSVKYGKDIDEDNYNVVRAILYTNSTLVEDICAEVKEKVGTQIEVKYFEDCIIVHFTF